MNQPEEENHIVSDMKPSKMGCHGGCNAVSAVSSLFYSCKGPEFDTHLTCQTAHKCLQF